ncbi:MAG: AMIN domain-containing protein [Desulfovibrio sp.]|nr:AMIN domain-containing protein [Desulfovibrio sp.]
MNKTIFGFLLAVSVLGMILVMLNTQNKQDEPPRFVQSGPSTQPAPLPPPAALAGGSAAEAETGQQGVSDVPPLPNAPTVPELPAPPAERPASPARMPEATPAADSTKAAKSVPPRADTGARAASSSAGGAGVLPSPREAAPQEQPQQVRPAPQPPAAVAPSGKADKPAQAAAPREKAAAPKGKATGKPSLSRFVVFARETGATVRMGGDQPIRYSHMQLDDPPRVVVDLEGDWQMTAPGVPGNPLVSKVRVGKPDGKTRVVIDLKAVPRKLRMVQSADRKTLDVRVDK